MAEEWYTAAELAALKLPGLPTHRTAFIRYAKKWEAEGSEWRPDHPQGVWRRREGQRGGGTEYHIALLPSAARAKLKARLAREAETPASPDEIKARLERDDAWQQYEAASDKRKARAGRKHAALVAVRDLVTGGMSKDAAVRLVGSQQGFSASSYYGWENKIAGVPREDWLAYLIDHYTGRTAQAEVSPEAWEVFKADYLRPEKPGLAECYNRLVLANLKGKCGWVIPSDKTLMRKLEREVDARVIVLRREGQEAHDRLFPAQQRDRSIFHAMQALNYDGHKLDVFVQWPGEAEAERAFLLAFQDLCSGKIVGWRLDRTENAYGFRLAFLDAVSHFGFPEVVYSDNTRAAAAKENTGGTRFRHRFKLKDDDPVGLFTQFGIDLRFTKPAHGQSKPIERAFGTLSRYISKAPECAGAYTGNTPGNKPANYGSKAVPLETLIAVCEREIARFNAQGNRQGATTKGTSCDAVFAASYADAPIRKPTPEQLRPWLLACEPVSCRKPDGAVYLHENRYWHESLTGMIGKKVVLRFDPDHLHQPVHVYRLDGSFVCTAECVAASEFDNRDHARQHAAQLKRFRRTTREMEKAQHLADIRKVAALQPHLVDAPAPEQRVVRPVFTTASRQAEAAGKPSQDQAVLAAFKRPSTGVEDPGAARFARAQRIEEMLVTGAEVAEVDSAWLSRYQVTPEYRARKRAAEEFQEFQASRPA